MRKKDLIVEVSNQTGLSIADTTTTVDAFIAAIKTNVTVGRPVFIRGFGTFTLKDKAARKARDIRANKIVDIPGHKAPTFKISKNF